jgi:hypothetical protein
MQASWRHSRPETSTFQWPAFSGYLQSTYVSYSRYAVRIPAHREQPKRLMLEQFQSRQRSWFPPKLLEETIIDASPEGLHASAQRSLALNGGGLKPTPDCSQSQTQ